MRKKSPDKTALISEMKELTYLQLFLCANAVALSFCTSGLQGERLAVHLPSSIDLAIIYLASLMTGTVIVPLSTLLKNLKIMNILLETSPKAFIGNS